MSKYHVKTFNLEQTAGCSCEQIVQKSGLHKQHIEHGCSERTIKKWIRQVAMQDYI